MNDSLQNGSILPANPHPSTSSFKLVVGGDVQASAGTYITRSVDADLLNCCLQGQFSYVLACRQIGKSSLKNAVAEHLLQQGWRVVRLDLNRIGQDVKKAEDWYFSLLDEIARRLALKFNIDEWWEQAPHSTWAQRFVTFFDSVVLQRVTEPIVIFIDEIDMTLGLSYTDDLFAAIRSIHNDRAQNPQYHRLTFVLLGVATPDQLVDAPKRTPFNIGHEIAMRDFASAECIPMLDLLKSKFPVQGEIYFNQIFGWTNGHPYLTQKLCQALVDNKNGFPVSVDELVREIFLSEEKQSELNLAFVHSHVLNDQHVRRMLRVYHQILQQEIIRDDQKSPAINRLKLYGLVVSNHGVLQVRNRIYEKIFDEQWCRENYPRNWRRIAANILLVFLTLVVIFAGVTFWHDTQYIPSQAERAELSCYRADSSTAWMDCLTNLFTLEERYWLFTTTAHTERALSFFFDLSAEEQLQLFSESSVFYSGTNDIQSTTSYSDTKNLQELYTVIKDVSSYLVDTRLLEEDNLNRTDELLLRMTEILTGTEKQIALLPDPLKTDLPTLHGELQHWSAARTLVRQNDLPAAQRQYDQAIDINGDNRATHFERAALLAATNQYEPALLDLERVVALIGQLPAISNEPTATTTSTPTHTPTIISTATSIASQPSGFSTRNPDGSAIFEPTAVPIIAATSTPIPVVIERITQRKLRNAVEELFAQYPALQAQAKLSGADFPSLAQFGFVLTPPTAVALALTATPTVSPTDSPVPLPTESATLTPFVTLTATPTIPESTATVVNIEMATVTPAPPAATETAVPTPPLPSATQSPTVPTATATIDPLRLTQAAVALTPVSTPTPTPNSVATQTALAESIATSISATLTALATVAPTATATQLLIASPQFIPMPPIFTPTLTPSPIPTSTPIPDTPLPPPTPLSPTPLPPTPSPSETPTSTAEAPVLPPLSGRIAFSRLNNNSQRIDTFIYCIATNSICMTLPDMRQPNFAADGRLVANGEGGGRDDIIRMNANYGEQQLISRHPEDAFPHVSPGGDMIVYSSTAAGHSLIYTQSSTRRPETEPDALRFTSVELVGIHPVYLWGGQIAYQGCDFWRSGANCGIYIVSDLITSQGAEPGRISTSTDDLPTDNLAGQVLFMSNRDGNWDVYLGNSDNRLTTDPAIDGLATASPDGAYIAFLTNREGPWAVYVMNNDGSGKQKLFDLGGSYGNGDKDWRKERLSWGP